MSQEIVKLQIPFESLVNAIASLGLEEKRRLWQMLNEQITQAEEDLLESEPYNWGHEGQPKGKPVEYIPGVGLAVIGGKDAPA
ncbi:hypothetical protein GS682_07600 [Nostoc sp. B(2019)]|uniref:hypothetical protein n=1 Tax=aff. Roholtiella sp. LEGE 12411 TaxID=1828822 RepID=UPI001391E158|nr:hypothetical protein [aff. Roholtiella sp. LEGE 12411]MBE9036899.1 hypothetical protein [aff. Roholtiella sp. LEGE 12411]NDJ21502.1 hypothetical protein [Nostoc sp. B(2019)]